MDKAGLSPTNKRRATTDIFIVCLASLLVVRTWIALRKDEEEMESVMN